MRPISSRRSRARRRFKGVAATVSILACPVVAAAFVPDRSPRLFHLPCSVSPKPGVEANVQGSAAPINFRRRLATTKRLAQYPFRRINTSTLTTIPVDNDIVVGSSRLFDDDNYSDHYTRSIEEAYRIVPESEREPKKQHSSSMKQQKPKRQTTHCEPVNQPAWVLQFSAAQQQMDQLKRATQTLIDEPLVECAGAGLILLSSILVAVTTLPNIPHEMLEPVEMVQDILSYLFFFEFLMRWLSCTEKRGAYVTKPLVLVDVVVVVLPLLLTTFPLLDSAFPDIISGKSGLINLRLLRVLRLQRVLRDELTFSRFLYSINLNPGEQSSSGATIVQQWELQLARVLLSIFTLLSVAAGLIYTAEHNVNPEIDDYFTALYFSITTLTTVGFGDITPITWQGKLIVSGFILGGITIIPSQAAALVEALFQRDEEKKQQLEEQERPRRKLQSARKGPVSTQGTAVFDDGALETAKKCPVCKVGLHWSHATYCYNCASPLQSESTPVPPAS